MRRYKEEEKEDILRKYKESGKTATQFAKENGIHRITLLKWEKTKRNKEEASNEAGEIVELNVKEIFTETKIQPESASIVLGLNGCVMQIVDGFNPETLRNVLNVVKQL